MLIEEIQRRFRKDNYKSLITIFFELVSIFFLLINLTKPNTNLLTSIISPIPTVMSLRERKTTREVFGFAPFWKFDSLDNVDFNVLTTFAYFGIPVNGDGSMDKTDPGYDTFKSDKATQIFNKAHKAGTRVVLTLTQMDNGSIDQLMDNQEAQDKIIQETITEVKNRGIDGVNIDFEYVGDPGDEYRNKFTNFVSKFTDDLHSKIPNSKLTVSVYASSVKDPKIYDIGKIASKTDGIFMMAYDFAVSGSDNAIPTSPLYGYKSGKYWYDVSTAVEDFLKVMPSNKLILGLPWYGYDYLVYQPEVKAETRPYWSWRGKPTAQTYSVAKNISAKSDGVTAYQTGWDNDGKVGWKAYYVGETNTWRMIFLEDEKSLGIKYDFAKSKNLGGVGIWALGFDEGRKEMWSVIREKFNDRLASKGVMETGL